MLSFLRRSPAGGLSVRPSRCRLALEPLEDRTVPYALSGYTWANPNVSVSFMPDGTLISSSYPSNLFAVYNAAYPQATWQREVARALQSWANVSNLNFHFVPDDGSPQGTAGLAQGDSRFGDIRIGGYNMGSGILGLGWNPGSTTTAGDVELSTSAALPIGSMPDLTSVLMHEFGHGIGFNHSTVDPAVMEGGLWGTYPAPYADDIAGVQAMYGARRPDAYDAAASNDTLASATALSLSYGGASFNADVTTMSDVDYYRVVVPSGSDGTLTVSVDARNLSLFAPNVSVFDASGALVATASASTYGDVATVHLTGLVAGQTYYLRAAGATTDVFGMGAYKLTAQFGGFTAPTISPDQFEPNNTTATATKLGTVSSVSQTGLTLHASTDVDYYAFTAAAKGTFAVSITPTQDSGTLSLTVLNAQQAVLASGQSQTGGVTLSVNLASGQQYYLKVWSPTGGLSTYTLSMAKAGASSGGSTGKGGHHLVVGGVRNPDEVQPEGDFFYLNAADDPENARPAPPRPTPGLVHTPLPAAALAIGRARSLAPSAADLPGGAGNRPPLLFTLDPPAPPVVFTRAAGVGPDRGSWIAPVPNLWPRGLSGEGGRGDTPPTSATRDATKVEWPAPRINPGNVDVTDPTVLA